jgi:uncharacterized membrane protein YqjE
MMSKSAQQTGPGHSIFGLGQRLLSTLVGIAETRLRLIVLELEEEKANLLHMLLMVGLIMIFTAFGLMMLILLIIFGINPDYRFLAISSTIGVLFGLAIILTIWVVIKSKRSSLLKSTRRELATDRKLLEERKDEQTRA